ncbi:MAG TPA: hypothetical protein DCZ01_08640 [Elusimicrobia bacterium]|nr:hypothetical protein [Elusimicrobiota bacterium]
MRFIAAALKVNSDLKRVADHATNIAEDVARGRSSLVRRPAVSRRGLFLRGGLLRGRLGPRHLHASRCVHGHAVVALELLEDLFGSEALGAGAVLDVVEEGLQARGDVLDALQARGVGPGHLGEGLAPRLARHIGRRRRRRGRLCNGRGGARGASSAPAARGGGASASGTSAAAASAAAAGLGLLGGFLAGLGGHRRGVRVGGPDRGDAPQALEFGGHGREGRVVGHHQKRDVVRQRGVEHARVQGHHEVRGVGAAARRDHGRAVRQVGELLLQGPRHLGAGAQEDPHQRKARRPHVGRHVRVVVAVDEEDRVHRGLGGGGSGGMGGDVLCGEAALRSGVCGVDFVVHEGFKSSTYPLRAPCGRASCGAYEPAWRPPGRRGNRARRARGISWGRTAARGSGPRGAARRCPRRWPRPQPRSPSGRASSPARCGRSSRS